MILNKFQSELYLKSCDCTKQDVQRFINQFGHLLKWESGKEDILEIGCAGGIITTDVVFPFVEKYVNKYVGVDMSGYMIDAANERNKNDKISFQVLDITASTEYIQNKMGTKFDKVLSFNCVQWIHDQSVWIRNCHSLLKDNGQIFVCFILWGPVHHVIRLQRQDERWSKFLQSTKNSYPLTTDLNEICFKRLMEENGFKVEKLHKIKRPVVLNDNIKEFWYSVNQFVDHIPDELKKEYKEDFVKLLEQVKFDYYKEEEFAYDSLMLVAHKI